MAPRRRRGLRTPPRSTRTKARVSYAESSGDESDRFEQSSGSEPEEQSPRTSQTATPRPNSRKRSRPTTRRSSRPSPHSASTSKRRRRTPTAPPKTHANVSVSPVIPSGVIPPWQTLPYHVWVQIFRYASYPLYDEHTFQPLPSEQWLLLTAYLCHAFAEPAFTVLYSSPPLVPMIQAHRLVDLLKSDPRSLAYTYRQKVESLRIDVGQVAAYSLPGSGHLDLHGLIKSLPRLLDLEFYHQKDMSPYRELDETIKWTYPESIFEALEYLDPAADSAYGDKTSVCQLRSWRWSSRLAGKKWPLQELSSIHLKSSFQSLQKLSFVNYHTPVLKKDEEDPKHESILANALKVLPNLKHLIFESSTLANAILLPLLPTNLRNLELINCWEIAADDFADFLLTHGRQLRCLTLNHNQSLSLGFLPVLGTACPHLQTFRMNLTYFNVHSSYRDSEPIFDQLLLPEQVPVWPTTLQVIEFIQLRKWETEAAEMFFQSLLDSAGTLPDLRRLGIQAILNIGWRDRASFRDKWVGSLNRVFKRVSKPPMILRTLRPAATKAIVEIPIRSPIMEVAQVKIPGHRSMANSASTVSINSDSKEKSSPPRRSARACKNKTGGYAELSDEDEPVDAKPSISREELRRTRLARELVILQDTAGIDAPAPHTPEDTSDSDEPLVKRNNKGKSKVQEVIQGMCESVEVRIDNLRPTEHQLTEENFIDSEKSGDEDWDGEDREDDGHAW